MAARPVIVLDPGHGGLSDVGGSSWNHARGPNGLLEKGVVVDLAQRVARELAQYAEVVLTRTEDRNLSLRERAQIARSHNAQFFLSLHLNGSHDSVMDGTEVWIPRNAGERVRSFAAAFARDVAAAANVPDRGIKLRNLGVLLPERHAPETQAFLLEAAYLSNPATARRLESAAERQQIAAGIAGAIAKGLGLASAQFWARSISLDAPLLDRVVAELDKLAGSSFGTFANYKSKLKDDTVFGRSVKGVHPDFLAILKKGEARALDLQKAANGTGRWDVASVGGFRSSAGWHNWGLAVDINYDACPYIMHEAGESKLDRELAPVYHRIAKFLLRRDSVIPSEITKGAKSMDRTKKLFDRLQEEHNAVKSYFACLVDPSRAERLLRDASKASPPLNWRGLWESDAVPSREEFFRILMRDYVTLAGRGGPPVPGLDYPNATTVKRDNKTDADRPFAGDPKKRAPEFGFLNVPREIVIGLSEQGLRWGAIDFGGESGDVMHFDGGNGTLAGKIRQAKKAAA